MLKLSECKLVEAEQSVNAKITFVCPTKMSYNRAAVEKFDLVFK